MARQRVPKPSAALPRAAGRLPEDCHKLPAGRALPALPRVGRVGRAYHLKTLIKLAELDREICRQAAGRHPAGCRQAAGSLRQSSGSLPAGWGRAAGGLGVRCQAPNPLFPPCKVLIRNSQH